MSTHKNIDKICCVVFAVILIISIAFTGFAVSSYSGESVGVKQEYQSTLFDTDKVHTINIIMEDWDSFIENCENEEYSLCSLEIDGEKYDNVAIRAKGNTSLTQVSSYGNNRYSFKIEFDHYSDTGNYYGLDKLNLNNIISDNTYMKDYITYQLMNAFGVDSSLCSYTQIFVNGEEWGLYLAIEGVEDSFLERNYGNDSGNLYKPDNMDMGGGRGNGDKFNMDDWENRNDDNRPEDLEKPEKPGGGMTPPDMPSGESDKSGESSGPGQSNMSNKSGESDGTNKSGESGEFGGKPPQMTEDMANKGPGGTTSEDVSLIYSDDKISSYSNIFDNAKTDVTKADKNRLISSLKALNENENIEDVVDVEEVIRYFVVHNFVCNFDSYTGSMIHNYYLYEKDGKLSMIPWDYNLAFGGFQNSGNATAMINYPIDSPVSGGTIESRPMLSWIFASEEYTEMYHEYFSEFIESCFSNGYFENMIDSVSEMISPYVKSDPTKFCTYEEFEKGVETLREFCSLRAESIAGQLSGTIPSTSDGQSQDDSKLVDATGISISDMGVMNMNGGKGGGPQEETNRGNENQANPNGGKKPGMAPPSMSEMKKEVS